MFHLPQNDVCGSLSVHTSTGFIVGGHLSGDVRSYAVTEDDIHESDTDTKVYKLMPAKQYYKFKKSCSVQCVPDSDTFCAVSSGKLLRSYDIDTSQVIFSQERVTTDRTNCLLAINSNLVAVGDNNGEIRVLDTRSGSSNAGYVLKYNHHSDWISQMLVDDSGRFMFATSGDGTLSVTNIRKNKLHLQSELFDAELLSMAFAKGGKKLLVGAADGCINIFNWGEWGNISDRFPCHPDAIDCMVSVDNDILLTGCSDGAVRALNILPNEVLSTVQKPGPSGLPIESVVYSPALDAVIVSSGDNTISALSIYRVREQAAFVWKNKQMRKKAKAKLKSSRLQTDNFFGDLAPPSGVSEQNNSAVQSSNDDDFNSESSGSD